MSSRLSHAGSAGLPAGGSHREGRGGWRAGGAALREKLSWVWYPLWLLAAVGITRVVLDLVARGRPTINFAGP